jgi:hypothetical protein
MTAATRSRIQLVIIAVLLLVIAAMAYKFIVAGATQTAPDGRVAVLLAPAERALMLREMRDFVGGLQLVADALARDDMQGVAKAARAMGTARSHDVPVGMMGKLPLPFKALAIDVHRGFDAIALDAEAIAMPKHTLGQLADNLRKCVACHARYQVSAPTTE